MTDIVERLRSRGALGIHKDTLEEAATEIERLRTALTNQYKAYNVEIDRLCEENEQLKAKLDQSKKEELITALEMLKAVVKDDLLARKRR